MFTGTTAECLEHLAKQTETWDQDRWLELRNDMAEFISVTTEAIYSWLQGKQKPVGSNLVRLRCYLTLLGYRVTEHEALDPVLRDLAFVVAFNLESLTNISNDVGYKIDTRNKSPSILIKVIRGSIACSQEKLELLHLVVDEHSNELVRRFESEKRSFLRSGTGGQSPTPRAPWHAPKSQNEAIIEAAGGMVKSLYPLLQQIETDDFSPAERSRLREISGGDGVFKVLNALSRLCGERARSQRHVEK